MTSSMRLAAVRYEAGFGIDEFMMKLGATLRAANFHVGGAVQRNATNAASACSAMALIDLVSGAQMQISQDLGSHAQGCRLDTGRLAEFGTLLDGTFGHDLDLLILNKFGKAEVEGGGLRDKFVRAIEAGVPVLTAVRPPYDSAWQLFHGGMAVDLAPDPEHIWNWCQRAVEHRRRDARQQPDAADRRAIKR